MGKIFQNYSSLKPLNCLKVRLPGIHILWWPYKNVTWQVIILQCFFKAILHLAIKLFTHLDFMHLQKNNYLPLYYITVVVHVNLYLRYYLYQRDVAFPGGRLQFVICHYVITTSGQVQKKELIYMYNLSTLIFITICIVM